jgi:hypothetical protein
MSILVLLSKKVYCFTSIQITQYTIQYRTNILMFISYALKKKCF